MTCYALQEKLKEYYMAGPWYNERHQRLINIRDALTSISLIDEDGHAFTIAPIDLRGIEFTRDFGRA